MPSPSRASPNDAPQRDKLHFRTDLAPLPSPPDLAERLAELAIELEPGDTERLGRYLAILLANNELLNLTAITDPAEAWIKHIFDALTLLPVLSESEPPASIADVGSGGGVPAIPLALVMPDHRFTLIEATAKKAEFLKAAAEALDARNIDVVADRAEVLGQDRHAMRERFDIVTARALGRLNVALELCAPLCKITGRLVLVKGQRAAEELEEARPAMEQLGVAHAGTIDTPTGRLVVLEKISRTPRTYPRPSGEPKRKPLS